MRDILLLVLGALLAFGVEEWRETRQREHRVQAALVSLRDELRANRQRVLDARARHRRTVDTLTALVVAGRARPPADVYLGGLFNPATVSSTAWQAARETGTVSDMPLSLVLRIAPAYEAQEWYRTLGDALVIGIMHDVRRDGMDVVLGDRYAQFITLGTDFANRERVLLAHYDRALAELTSSPPGAKR